MDATNSPSMKPRSNSRIALLVVWIVAALVSIPAVLALKFVSGNAGWYAVMLMLGGVVPLGVWMLLGFIPLFILRDYDSNLVWAWTGLAMVFTGFIIGGANLPDFGDTSPAGVPAWWFGNEDAATMTGMLFLGISAVGHVLWLVSCIVYAVKSHRQQPPVL